MDTDPTTDHTTDQMSEQISEQSPTQSFTSGILLHPSSLAGPYGMGSLGAEAQRWIDWLSDAGQRVWQVLPLGPTGYGDSPYQSFSAFAGNPYLIDLPLLIQAGLLRSDELSVHLAADVDPQHIDFGRQFIYKNQALDLAFERFMSAYSMKSGASFEMFCRHEAHWLDDYALFMAIKHEQNGAAWMHWPDALKNRHPDVLEATRKRLHHKITREKFVQFLFFGQWNDLHDYARSKDIRIMGDMPIFVALDSSDAWAEREQFLFDGEGQPVAVAGVPPDYFSETGQLWGNPLYNWPAMQERRFDWWLRRLRSGLELYDLLRIDHFRGFAGYWHIPFPAENAMQGEWRPALGADLFAQAKAEFGHLPIIAEDLGIITPDVEKLRDDTGFPGMAILQFAFGDPDYKKSPFLPENMPKNRVVYTGTHDNNTSRGWWNETSEHERQRVQEYVGHAINEETIASILIEMALNSPAELALVPMQDVLNLGSEARMNRPGEAEHNWTWRMPAEALSSTLADKLKQLAQKAGRQ